MAPEQAGKARHVGPAADVYSLGAILYELLTGRRPFDGATAVDIIMQVVSDEPVAPRTLRPDLPVEMENICLKCLQKDQGRRYASAQALANDLRRFLADEPVRARKTPPWDAALKWARDNPVLAGLMAVVALLFLLGVLQTTLFR
jgi:serine/threonine protein kinase